MTTTLQMVKELQRLIRLYSKLIGKIQKKCPHRRVRHKLFPDIYGNQGSSTACLDCGKDLGCSSSRVPDKIKTRAWTETKK